MGLEKRPHCCPTKWCCQVRQYGYEILHLKKKRVRSPKDPVATPNKKDPRTDLEKLQVENFGVEVKSGAKKENLIQGTGSPSNAQWAHVINGLKSEYSPDILM